jgi:hypothetical protein
LINRPIGSGIDVKREKEIGEEINTTKAPANRAGNPYQGATSSSANSAAQSEFAKAKQSAIAENTGNTQKSNNTQNSKDKTNSQQHAAGQAATTRTSTAGSAATNAASSPGGWTAPLQPLNGGPVGFYAGGVQKPDVGGCHGGCQASHHKTQQPKLEAPVMKPTQVTAESIRKWQTDGEATRKAQEEAEKAEYEKVGRRIAPYGDTFTPLDEVKELFKQKGFSDSWVDDNKNYNGFSDTYWAGDKLTGGYTVVSPQWGIVKRDVNGTEYYFRIGTENMEKLKVSTHISDNSTTAQDVWHNSRGVNIAWAYVNKAAAWAAETFGGPLGGAGAPVLKTAADQGLQDVRRIDARHAGQDFNEKKIEVNSKTAIDSVVGAVSGPVGNKVSKSVQSAKVVANSAVKAKIASHVAAAAVSKEIAQAGEVAKSAIDGKGVSATDFVPSVGADDAVGVIKGAVVGRVQKTWTGGRTPSTPKIDGHSTSSSSGTVEKPSAKPLPSQAPLSLQHDAPQPQTGQAPPTSPPSGGNGGHGGGDHGGAGASGAAGTAGGERSAGGTPRSGSNAGVVSGEIVSRELAGGAPHAPAQPKVIVDRSAYSVEPGQAGMSKALGLDPSKTQAVAHASDGHGADFQVVTTKPMNRLPNGAMRGTATTTEAGNVSIAKKSTPAVETPARSPVPHPDPNVVARSARNVYPEFEPVPPAQEKYARAQTAGLSQQIQDSGIKMTIPADRVLSAPWVNSKNSSGERPSSATSEGWLRSQSRFWTQWKKQFPDDAKLLGPNQTVTKELADKYGWPTSGPNNVVGQKLAHHHIDNGALTVALPENVHQKLSGNIHATATVVGEEHIKKALADGEALVGQDPNASVPAGAPAPKAPAAEVPAKAH